MESRSREYNPDAPVNDRVFRGILDYLRPMNATPPTPATIDNELISFNRWERMAVNKFSLVIPSNRDTSEWTDEDYDDWYFLAEVTSGEIDSILDTGKHYRDHFDQLGMIIGRVIWIIDEHLDLLENSGRRFPDMVNHMRTNLPKYMSTGWYDREALPDMLEEVLGRIPQNIDQWWNALLRIRHYATTALARLASADARLERWVQSNPPETKQEMVKGKISKEGKEFIW